MQGLLDFLHGAMGGSGQGSAPPVATSGPGSAADPFKALPTLPQGGFLQGIDPTKLQQAGAGVRDGQDPAQADPGMQQIMQMRAQHQQLLQQLLGGR